MGKNFNDQQGMAELKRRLNLAIAEQFKSLLQDKHMYQKVVIDAAKIFAEVKQDVSSAWHPEFTHAASRFSATILLTSKEGLYSQSAAGSIPDLFLIAENVKLFCAKCDRREAFEPKWYKDVTNEMRTPTGLALSLKLPATFQWFVIVYQCQSCNGLPEAVLVKRENWQFFLHGRSPIEHVELPAYLPKAEKHWFRDAVIALHGGKTLAALFYMRIFIEQFARRQTGLSGKKTGDEIMCAYAETLPKQHRDYMPSLREWYEKLSQAIHSATEDADLFEESRKEIERHFDIRRVFGISETPAVVQNGLLQSGSVKTENS
jgi:hypothetical protein